MVFRLDDPITILMIRFLASAKRFRNVCEINSHEW